MNQTVYPERRTREQRGEGETGHDVDAFRARQASTERHPFPAPRSDGLVVTAYERFLWLPVPVVLATLWVSGAALVGWVLLILYAIGTSLAS